MTAAHALSPHVGRVIVTVALVVEEFTRTGRLEFKSRETSNPEGNSGGKVVLGRFHFGAGKNRINE